jgi:hypothetical protein
VARHETDSWIRADDTDVQRSPTWQVIKEQQNGPFPKPPPEELYDLRIDPDHLTNVADDPAYETVRAEMESRLFAVLEAQDDPRLMEQPCRFELEPYAGDVRPVWFESAIIEHRRFYADNTGD